MPFFLSILAIGAALLTGYMEWLGAAKSFFWYYPWFDIPLHMVGGLTIGLWGSAISWPRNYTRYQSFFYILLLAMAVGLLWELFEFVSGLTEGEPGYWLDTIADLANDIIGAMAGWGLYSLFYWVSRKRQ